MSGPLKIWFCQFAHCASLFVSRSAIAPKITVRSRAKSDWPISKSDVPSSAFICFFLSQIWSFYPLHACYSPSLLDICTATSGSTLGINAKCICTCIPAGLLAYHKVGTFWTSLLHWQQVIAELKVTVQPKIGGSKVVTIALPLKGQSHEIFCFQFFHQTAPPGPIRDVLGLIRFLVIFHKVIGLLKQVPGTLATGESQLPGFQSTRKSYICKRQKTPRFLKY